MKCKKCGFISFDFNQACPKCNRSLAYEQMNFNLPSFRPNPPMLLKRLLGEDYNDSGTIVRPGGSTIMEEAEELYTDLDKSLSGMKEDSEDKLLLKDEEEPFDLSIEDDNLILDDSMIDSSEAIGDTEKEIPLEGGEGILEEETPFSLDDLSFEDLDAGETGHTGLKNDLMDKTAEPENAPIDESGLSEDKGKMDDLYPDINAEGLTKEIDMKKFIKDKGDKTPE